MALKRFEIGLAAQVLSIFVVCAALAWLAATTKYYATAFVLAVVLVLQVAMLLKYVRRTNRELSRFLLAVQHADFSQSFSPPFGGSSFAELASAFDDVLRRFRDARSAKEEQASYLETLVQHVPVAVLAWDETGRIDLLNQAARRLLGVSGLRRLHDFQGFGPKFAARLSAVATGMPHLLEAEKDGELLQLNVTSAELRTRERSLKIVTLQDIRGELESRELAAWQNLIRILTHEIMNSVTPIASLASTAAESLDDAGESGEALDIEAIADARQAVETIEARSAGLLRFVESYRRLTRVPSPVLSKVRVDSLIARIVRLMRPELERRGIKLEISVTPAHLEIEADPDLIEQVLINLLQNAADALADTPEPLIATRAVIGRTGRAILSIADNGRGMDDELRQNIFVPFFTTKRNGTGIGLSLVRQIMRAHGGTVGVRSAPGRGTEMRLSF